MRASRLACLVVVAIVFSACATPVSPSPATSGSATGTTSTNAPPSTASSSSPSSGGTLTIAYVGPCCEDVDHAAPLAARGSYAFLDKIYEPLIEYSIDPSTNGYGPIVPALAASWTTSDDHLTWTFKLQPGVKWQDGSDFTSADVAFSLALCSDPKFGSCIWKGQLSSIVGSDAVDKGTATDLSGVKTSDPLTVEITTSYPNAAFLDTMSRVWIVQKKSLETIPRDQLAKSPYWTTPGQAIGTGPFKLASYQQGQSMELSRFDQYWRGKPLLDKIIRRQFADPATALLAFDRGEVDLTYLTADEVARERANANATVIAGPANSTNLIQQNPNANPALGNKLFLQGLVYAIDRPTILQQLYGGAGEPVDCYLGQPAYRAGQTPRPYDVDKAKALIAQSGVDVSSLPEFEMITYYSDSLSLNVMTAIQGYWAAVGVKAKPVQLDNATFDHRLYEEGKFDVAFEGGGNGPDGNIMYGYSRSDQGFPKGGNGFKGWAYQNKQLDPILDAARQEFDPAKRDALYQQVCQITADDPPWVNLWQTTRYWVASKKVGTILVTPAAAVPPYDAAQTWSVNP